MGDVHVGSYRHAASIINETPPVDGCVASDAALPEVKESHEPMNGRPASDGAESQGSNKSSSREKEGCAEHDICKFDGKLLDGQSGAQFLPPLQGFKIPFRVAVSRALFIFFQFFGT